MWYIYRKWLDYSARYSDSGKSFQERDEPTLTEGFAAFLVGEYWAGRQPFDGDFISELRHYDLQSDGTAKCIGRTDIEWRLFGWPCFILEFKILDGGGARRDRCLGHGVQRFVDGRYAPRSGEGAMCGLLRTGGERDAKHLEAMIVDRAAVLCCHPPGEPPVVAPSRLAPSVARFDTAHSRSAPAVNPFHLAHVFMALP